MIGRDYYSWGSRRHISHRYGDNHGNPYTGPICFFFLNSYQLLVLNKFHTISVQNLLNAIECHIHPIIRKSSLEVVKAEEVDQMEEWEIRALSVEMNETAQDKFTIREVFIDALSMAISFIWDTRTVIIADSKCTIKLYDLNEFKVIKSFGEFGTQPGGILRPTAISYLKIGQQGLIILGDSGENQRLSVYTVEGEFITTLGSDGPLPGQFRDIVSIDIKPLELLKTPVNININPYTYSFSPRWYRGTLKMDHLEDALYDEHLNSNFVVGRREYDHSIYDLLYISSAKQIVRLQIKYVDKIEEKGDQIGFYISNRVGEKIVYPSILDLIKKQPGRELRVKEESRDCQFFATVDRRNFRIQIIRFFWTKSLLFSPSMEVVKVIGGIKSYHCDLRDPVCVAYSPGSDLAICDLGRHSIFILSPNYEIVKVLQLQYLSTKDLSQGSVGRRRNPLTPLELQASKQPCHVTFGRDSSLAVGFNSGGIYIFKPNEVCLVGVLDKLEFNVLSKIIIDYLTYPDIVQMRNSCRFLHNFTRELRFQFKIFPPHRRITMNKFLHNFLHWARIGAEGADNLVDIVLLDKFHHPICPHHLRAKCNINNCPKSHSDVFYDRADFDQTKAFVTYEDFLFFVSDLFSPQMMYQHEVHIQQLFLAYSNEQLVYERHDRLRRKDDFIREKVMTKQPVLYFSSLLEVVLALEEHFDGFKSLLLHKLFAGGGQARHFPKVATNFATLEDKTAYTDILEQYEHGIEVSPIKQKLGRRIVTRKGYENAARSVSSPLLANEHIKMFNRHADRAADALSKLFS